MTRDDQDEPEQSAERAREEPVRYRPLTTWERSAAGASGAVMIGAGAAAIFLRNLEVGPTALIAIGAALAIMAITGSPITKAKFGENEVNLAARRQVADAIEASRSVIDADAVIETAQAYDPGITEDPSVHRSLERIRRESMIISAIRNELSDEVFDHNKNLLATVNGKIVAVSHREAGDQSFSFSMHTLRGFPVDYVVIVEFGGIYNGTIDPPFTMLNETLPVIRTFAWKWGFTREENAQFLVGFLDEITRGPVKGDADVL